VLRLRLDQEDRLKIAVISIDPSRRRGGGALLGDRIRMNAIEHEHIFMRSWRRGHRHGDFGGAARSDFGVQDRRLRPDHCRNFRDRQGNADRAAVDVSLYVMTPEFGAASQLEKIDMLDSPISSRSTSSTGRAQRTHCGTCASNISAIGSFFGAPAGPAGLRHPGEPVQR